MPSIWSLEAEGVYENLNTTPQGLSTEEAVLRLKKNGFNELPEPPTRPLWLRLSDQLTHFMALLLWVAGILAFISHTPQLGWAIWSVILINAIFSFWQEYQAEKALSALKQVLPLQVKVRRDDNLQVMPARELVPGDVIELEEGDRIPADIRLVEAESFYVDVSVLTGESLPVSRHSRPVKPRRVVPLRNGTTLLHKGESLEQEKIPPAEIANLVFAGSTVASGRATGVIYATGSRTEFGQVAHLTTMVKRQTSTLELQINQLVRVITIIAVTVGVLIFMLSHLLVGMETRESLIFAIGIIVALVPEGLLPTVTLSLAMGVQRMAKRNALVRRLSAVETLSATDVICTDKTGTLTQNEMTVSSLWVPTSTAEGCSIEVTGTGYQPLGNIKMPANKQLSWQVELLLSGCALCSNARLIPQTASGLWSEIGDPTEAALLVAALKANLSLDTLHRQFPRLREIPFDSRRRMMTVVLNWQSSSLWASELPNLVFTKGAPLEVLRHCNWILEEEHTLTLTHSQREQISTANDRLAREGFRVLGLAARRGGQELLAKPSQSLEQDLIFLGLVAMFDPPRPGVAEAIDLCYQAGITVTMVTGDYGLTAEAIARRLGLVKNKAKVITGEDLGHLSDAQLRQILHHRSELIFARMTPEHKLRLVQAYQSLGHIVAVTGDGVNDAPALSAGNIGIAMGISGTDVAREAADIVLLDDNFATIVNAIAQGRAVYQNIRKFITYILASNVAEVIPFLAMVILKIPPALLIMQILAIDLGTDMIPALALGAELPEKEVMKQLPRRKSRQLLDRSILLRAYGFLGLIEALAGMTIFFLVWWSYGYNLAALQRITPAIIAHSANVTIMAIYQQATTATLATIVACQDGNVFACRSEQVSIFKLGFFSNRLIWLGIAVEWTLILSIIYLSPLQIIFTTAPLFAWQWLILLIFPPLLIITEEMRKRITNRKSKRNFPPSSINNNHFLSD